MCSPGKFACFKQSMNEENVDLSVLFRRRFSGQKHHLTVLWECEYSYILIANISISCIPTAACYECSAARSRTLHGTKSVTIAASLEKWWAISKISNDNIRSSLCNWL